VRYVQDGVCTATLSLATSTPGYTLPGGTQVPERTEWHNLLFWRKTAEIVERYVHKGDKIYVEGELRTRTYTDKRGQTRYVTEVWVKDLEMLTPKARPAETATPPAQTDNNAAPQSATAPDEMPF